ncbi:hypothetical protein J4G48_0015895 [Bradyrhizobium barranii subsp. apii]|uniref:hypothetical protein n=1 Tax=Bradyrhizobium barranii TaxID=2992140 RepID=UPI001AA1317B|nr:hypothetical protein [Bradyrhizobium barranii]UPT99437.1 hypothetical protein J4G48_0015895 [Bradyrhizobium barranii subsp. apii]
MALSSVGTKKINSKSQFVSKGAWKLLTAGAKSARKPALAAVAYFGKGASKLLPLPSGKVAQSRRKRKRGYIVDSFWWPGKCPYYENDKVVQVTEYANGERLIDAPADVIHTRPWRGRDGREVTFVYLELPDVRRVSLKTLAKRLGRGAKKNLYKNGIVRDDDFAEKLLANWNQL